MSKGLDLLSLGHARSESEPSYSEAAKHTASGLALTTDDFNINERLIAKDALKFMENLSLESVVGAVVDLVNVKSPYTTSTEPSVVGTTLVGVVLDGYAPGILEKVEAGIDLALRFGVLYEEDLLHVAKDPTTVTRHLKPMLEEITASRATPELTEQS